MTIPVSSQKCFDEFTRAITVIERSSPQFRTITKRFCEFWEKFEAEADDWQCKNPCKPRNLPIMDQTEERSTPQDDSIRAYQGLRQSMNSLHKTVLLRWREYRRSVDDYGEKISRRYDEFVVRSQMEEGVPLMGGGVLSEAEIAAMAESVGFKPGFDQNWPSEWMLPGITFSSLRLDSGEPEGVEVERTLRVAGFDNDELSLTSMISDVTTCSDNFTQLLKAFEAFFLECPLHGWNESNEYFIECESLMSLSHGWVRAAESLASFRSSLSGKKGGRNPTGFKKPVKPDPVELARRRLLDHLFAMGNPVSFGMATKWLYDNCAETLCWKEDTARKWIKKEQKDGRYLSILLSPRGRRTGSKTQKTALG